MRKSVASLAVLFLCAPLAWAGSPAIPGSPPKLGQKQSASSAAAQLRREYYAQDFSRVIEDGEPMLKQYPDDLELRGWYVVTDGLQAGFLVEALRGRDDLVALVNQMKQSAPASPWTLLASASAAAGLQEKIALCQKAIAGAGNNPDVLVLATDIVRRAALSESDSRHTPRADALKKFLAEHKNAYKRSSNGLAAEAEALATVAQIEKNAKSRAALKLADRILKADPENVAALLLKSQILVRQQMYQANDDLLKIAAAAVPDSYALHLAYWKAVLAVPNAKPAEQEREILADAARIFSAAEPSVQITQTSLATLHRASPGLAKAFGDLLLKSYPRSGIEDAVLLHRATADETVTEEENDAEISRLEAFIGRPRHYDSELLHRANGELVEDLIDQENPDLARLYRAELDSAGKSTEMSARGIVVLADRQFRLADLETLASEQLDAQWIKFQTLEKDASAPRDLVQAILGAYPGEWLDALGWVEFQESRIDAALPELKEALQLNPRDSQIPIHLGRAYEAKGENARAEALFRKALSMPYSGEGDNPAIAALRHLYAGTHGGEKGLEAYMKPILAEDAARREKTILAARLNPGKPLPSFELASPQGKDVTSEGLKGKYLVLNFWATW